MGFRNKFLVIGKDVLLMNVVVWFENRSVWRLEGEVRYIEGGKNI